MLLVRVEFKEIVYNFSKQVLNDVVYNSAV